MTFVEVDSCYQRIDVNSQIWAVLDWIQIIDSSIASPVIIQVQIPQPAMEGRRGNGSRLVYRGRKSRGNALRMAFGRIDASTSSVSNPIK